MKRIWAACLLCVLFGKGAGCAPVYTESPFEVLSGPTAVGVSTSTWTALTSSTSGTFGTFFKDLDTNRGSIRIIATASSAAPATSTMTWQWSVAPSANAMYLGGSGQRVWYWGVDSGAGEENVVVTEVRPVKATYP